MTEANLKDNVELVEAFAELAHKLDEEIVKLKKRILELENKADEPLKEKFERVVRIIKEINDKFPLDELRKMYPQSDPPLIPCPVPYPQKNPQEIPPLYPYPWYGVVPPWWMYPPVVTKTSNNTTGAKPE